MPSFQQDGVATSEKKFYTNLVQVCATSTLSHPFSTAARASFHSAAMFGHLIATTEQTFGSDHHFRVNLPDTFLCTLYILL